MTEPKPPNPHKKQKGAPVVGRQYETMFGGPRGNKPGQTSETRKRTILAAEKAAIARDIMLDSLVDVLSQTANPQDVIDHIRSDVLKLVHEALDRGYGKAQASVDVTSSDMSMSPAGASSDAVLEALKRKHASND